MWRAANPEKMKLYKSRRNKEKDRETGRLYRRLHPEKSKKWEQANPHKMKEYARVHHLAKFGLTPASYEALLAKQNGLCAICKRPETSVFKGNVRSLAIDHDQNCRCNTAGL